MTDLHDALQNLPRGGVTDPTSPGTETAVADARPPHRRRHRDPGRGGGVFRVPESAVGGTGGCEGAPDPIDRRAAARQLFRRSEPGLLRRGDDRRTHLGPRAHEPDPGDLARFGDAVRGQTIDRRPPRSPRRSMSTPSWRARCCDPATRSGSMRSSSTRGPTGICGPRVSSGVRKTCSRCRTNWPRPSPARSTSS